MYINRLVTDAVHTFWKPGLTTKFQHVQDVNGKMSAHYCALNMGHDLWRRKWCNVTCFRCISAMIHPAWKKSEENLRKFSVQPCWADVEVKFYLKLIPRAFTSGSRPSSCPFTHLHWVYTYIKFFRDRFWNMGTAAKSKKNK